MSQEFSKEELERIWEKVKPSPEQINSFELKKCSIEITQVKQTIDAKNIQKIFPELDFLKEKVRVLEDKYSMLEKLLSEKKEERKEIELTLVPENKAKSLIEKYIAEHPGCLTGDIIFDLELDPDLVLEILNKLEKEKTIRGDSIEQ